VTGDGQVLSVAPPIDCSPRSAETSAAASVWRLAWPVIAHMTLVTLVFMADRALIGHYATGALASLQISTTLSWTVYSVFASVAVGALALVARLVGGGKRAEAALATRAALSLALAGGALAVVPLLVADGALLEALFPHAGAEVLEQADAYLRIVLPALPLAFLEAVAAACLQAAGDTRSPLRAAAVANLVNLGLSACLIAGLCGFPALGVRGAAIGSAVAFAIQALMLLRVLAAPGSPLPILGQASSLGEHAAMLRRLLRVSLPALGEKLAFHAGYLGYVAMIGLLGATAMAANQALIGVEALSYTAAEGFGIAAGALVGQELGAGRARQAAASWIAASGLAVVAVVVFAGLFLLAPGVWLGLFSQDAAVTAEAAAAMPVVALIQPAMAFAVVASMALRGAGCTRLQLGLTLLCSVGVRLGATWWLAVELDLGLLGVWLGSALDWLVHAALLAWVLLDGRWRRARV
jgi:putative MATE family efflux protein